MSNSQSLTLKQVQADFAKWRKGRTSNKGFRIPDHLWQRAIELAKTHPVTSLVKSLRLNHSAFKAHLKAPQKEQRQPSKAVNFVQLDQNQLLGSHENMVIELKRLDGSSMTVRASSAQVANVMEAFLGGIKCYN